MWGDAIWRLKPFKKGMRVDQMNDQTGPGKPNPVAGIPDIPIDRRQPHAAGSRAGIFMRIRREWTNLGALITLHADIIVSDTRRRVFGRERRFQKLTQLLRHHMCAHAQFIERASIGIEDLAEAFVRSEKSRLGKVARAHPSFNLSQRYDLSASRCQ